MGKTIKGGATHEKNIKLLTKDQSKFLKKVLKKETSGAKEAYGTLLEGQAAPNLSRMLSPSKQAFTQALDQGGQSAYHQFNNMGTGEADFNTGVVNPMLQRYRQDVLPALQQRFIDANAGSSSALNQALAASANDLTTQMGSLYLPFQQGRQQLQMQAAQGRVGERNARQELQMQAAQGLAGLTNPYLDIYKTKLAGQQAALSGLGSLAGQQAFTPLISQQQGLGGPLIGAAGGMGAAAIMASSEKVKENIRDYDKGLDVVKKLSVKMYDYKEEAGGAKNKIGVIAETVPQEVQGEINGIKAVDLYGLIGLLINSVKELNEKVEELRGKV